MGWIEEWIVENPGDHGLVLEACDHPKPAAAASAALDLDGEDAL